MWAARTDKDITGVPTAMAPVINTTIHLYQGTTGQCVKSSS